MKSGLSGTAMLSSALLVRSHFISTLFSSLAASPLKPRMLPSTSTLSLTAQRPIGAGAIGTR